MVAAGQGALVRYLMPKDRPGQRVGLLGGSFDPPHEGHVHITLQALRRLRLDAVWWLISPGNPLKSRGPAPISRRHLACEELFQHPRVFYTDIEAMLGTRYTAETLLELQRLYPRIRFTWLMGADNMAEFHRWEDWNLIMRMVPVGVFSRPGENLSAGLSRAAGRYARFRWPGGAGALVPKQNAPAWVLLGGPTREISSTDIRQSGGWR